jgi:hypothetical protein
MALKLLALELLFAIVTLLPDLDTLYNLLPASPASSRLSVQYALPIFEAVLSGPNALLSSHKRELICAVVLARSSVLPFRTLHHFHRKFLRGKLSYTSS